MFSGVPVRPGALFNVGGTFGFTRETNFGALFDVRSTAEASDLAYTSLPLDPHTDNPYRDPVPGVQLLHCLVNETSGGLVDARRRLRGRAGPRGARPGGLRPAVAHAGPFPLSGRSHRTGGERGAHRA